uniref:hypothetical protein n=1 Tax=Rothia mucilaginosa TaxID=43675 RepID=UPI0028D4A918
PVRGAESVGGFFNYFAPRARAAGGAPPARRSCAFLRLDVMRPLSTAPLADRTRNQLPGYHARGVMRHSRFADSAKIEKDFFRPQFAA